MPCADNGELNYWNNRTNNDLVNDLINTYSNVKISDITMCKACRFLSKEEMELITFGESTLLSWYSMHLQIDIIRAKEEKEFTEKEIERINK